MANRREFSAATRKLALKRSGLICEAIGDWYGLPAGERCTNRLSRGVEYDHLILDANSKDNSLDNCRAVCMRGHRWKTANRDTPLAAKTVAQSQMGMRTRPKAKIPARPGPVSERTARKQDNPKASLPPKAMFREVVR